jgi:hypothetical protein
LCFWFILTPLTTQAQESKSFEGITTASQDVKGQLYLGFDDGQVIRLDENMETSLVYSPPQASPVTLLDASNGLRLFAYYEHLQEYVILDRFLTETARYSLAQLTPFASKIAPSLNNNVWVLETRNFSIQKVNPRFGEVEFTIPLEQLLPPDDYVVSYLQEYQNLLFIADPGKGIFIFDNLGNLLDRINIEDVEHFSFQENLLVIPSPNGANVYNIYSKEMREIRLEEEPGKVFKNNYGWWIVRNNTITRIKRD